MSLPHIWDSLDVIAEYWRADGGRAFPALQAVAHDWSRPLCFRCGWRAPTPDKDTARPWSRATGWLERAHLQDGCSGGPNRAHNLVPLCGICHRIMPSFPNSPAPAIEWVGEQEHSSCPRWWQSATDSAFCGDGFIHQPGSTHMFGIFVALVHKRDRVEESWRLAEDGDLPGAVRLMRLAGFDEDSATALTKPRMADALAGAA